MMSMEVIEDLSIFSTVYEPKNEYVTIDRTKGRYRKERKREYDKNNQQSESYSRNRE